jgi:hypothetical protein
MGDGVIVECFGLRAIQPGLGTQTRLVGRRVHGTRRRHPDDDAADLIGLLDSPLDGVALLHSTSWRFDPSSGVVLTYMCCPDPRPDADGELIAAAQTHTGTHDSNPSRPHDPHADLTDVLHHGIDHLAWLDDHHRHLTTHTTRIAPEIWAAVRLAGRHRAGQRTTPTPAAARIQTSRLDPLRR